MPFELNKFEVMEFLWDSIDKTPDGLYIRYSEKDINELWWVGFVDTENISMTEWKAAMEPFRQSDNSFLLSKEEFFTLDKFRYKGEIKIPFDAMLINEGKYTSDGFSELVEASIAPSLSLPREVLGEFVEKLKSDFRQDDGLILIKKPAKERIKAVIEAYPSPLRNLELLFDRILKQHGEFVGQEVEGFAADKATAEAALQASHFHSEPATLTEAKAEEFKKVAKSKQRYKDEEVKDVEKVELKKIKRSRKGMRG